LQSTHYLTVARLAWCSHPMRVSRLIAGTVCCYFDLIEPRCSFVSSSWTVVFSSQQTDVRNGTFWLTQDALKAKVWGPELVGLGAAVYLVGSTERARPRSFGVLWIPQLFGRLSYEVYLFHMFFLVGIGPISHLASQKASSVIRFDIFLMAGSCFPWQSFP